MLGKPTASLSSGLLARKGHARPAMRPQGFVPMAPTGFEDLGWNDMGDEAAHAAHHPQLQPQPVPVAFDEQPTEPQPEPTVLRQRAELEEQIAAQPEFEPEPEFEEAYEPGQPAFEPPPVLEQVSAPRSARRSARRAAAEPKSKAAFTLRLDHDRHLRLRLASAVRNHSAQQLVTEALDAFLDSLPDVDALARQLAAQGGRKSGDR